MKILICGTRMKGYDYLVREKLYSIKKPFEIIEGCCPNSADQYAEDWFKENKEVAIGLNHYPAEWDKYGKSAGFKRNCKMVIECDKIIAFWDGKSKGTAHTISYGKAHGKEVEVILIK